MNDPKPLKGLKEWYSRRLSFAVNQETKVIPNSPLGVGGHSKLPAIYPARREGLGVYK